MARTTETKHFLGATGPLASGRVGVVDGRATRTFHCHFGSVRVADASAGTAIDYAARIDTTAEQTAELEHVAGDVDALRRAAEAVDAAAVVRRGPTAERVMVKQTVELPAEASAAQRREAAEAIIADWQARGHVAIAAVHGNGLVQPHVHVLATARPVDDAGRVDRSRTLWPTKQAVREERARIATIVNEACRPAVEFHPGRLAETGIARQAERRLPARAYFVRQQRAPDPVEVERLREAKRAERRAAAARPPRAGTMLELDIPAEALVFVRQISGVVEDEAGRFGILADHSNAANLADRFVVAGRTRPKRGEFAELAAAASRRAGIAAVRVRELAELSAKQRQLIDDVYAELGLELPDIATDEGRAEAFARVRQARPRPSAPRASPAPALQPLSDAERRAADESAAAAAARRAKLRDEARAEAKRKSAEAAALRAARQRQRDDDRGL